jgi:glycerate 2-kinase
LIFGLYCNASALIVLLDDGLKHIAYLLKKDFGKEIDFIEGAGAAGGAGGICFALLHATMKRGIDLVKDLIDFDKRVANADLIITGEGKMDVQTLNRKVPMGVLQSGKELDIPVIALCGSVDDNISFNDYGFTSVFSIQRGPTTLSNSMEKANALQNIETIITQIMKLFAI